MAYQSLSICHALSSDLLHFSSSWRYQACPFSFIFFLLGFISMKRKGSLKDLGRICFEKTHIRFHL